MGRDLHPQLSPADLERLLRRGVEHFNAGAFYECHEDFEEIWRSTTPEPRDLFQGLIQVAVGLHHALRNGRVGAGRRVLARGRRRLAALEDGECGPAGAAPALRLEVGVLLGEVDRWLDHLAQLEAGGEGGPPPPLPHLRWSAPGGGPRLSGTDP